MLATLLPRSFALQHQPRHLRPAISSFLTASQIEQLTRDSVIRRSSHNTHGNIYLTRQQLDSMLGEHTVRHISKRLETYVISPSLQLWALNVDQSAGGNPKLVFRDWHDRLNFAAPAVQSNADDPEILIHIPFDGSVKLKAICVIGKPSQI